MEHPANFEDSNFLLAVQTPPAGNAVHKRACHAILCRMMIIKKLSDDCTNFITRMSSTRQKINLCKSRNPRLSMLMVWDSCF